MIHANEWNSLSAALNLIGELTENNAVNSALLDQIDFIVVPVVNPDGYVYAYDSVSEHSHA